MHLREVGGITLNTIDAHLPSLAGISSGIALRFVDVGILAKEMAPFSEPDANIEDRARTQLA
jgi:hypothetical protein